MSQAVAVIIETDCESGNRGTNCMSGQEQIVSHTLVVITATGCKSGTNCYHSNRLYVRCLLLT